MTWEREEEGKEERTNKHIRRNVKEKRKDRENGGNREFLLFLLSTINLRSLDHYRVLDRFTTPRYRWQGLASISHPSPNSHLISPSTSSKLVLTLALPSTTLSTFSHNLFLALTECSSWRTRSRSWSEERNGCGAVMGSVWWASSWFRRRSRAICTREAIRSFSIAFWARRVLRARSPIITVINPTADPIVIIRLAFKRKKGVAYQELHFATRTRTPWLSQ